MLNLLGKRWITFVNFEKKFQLWNYGTQKWLLSKNNITNRTYNCLIQSNKNSFEAKLFVSCMYVHLCHYKNFNFPWNVVLGVFQQVKLFLPYVKVDCSKQFAFFCFQQTSKKHLLELLDKDEYHALHGYIRNKNNHYFEKFSYFWRMCFSKTSHAFNFFQNWLLMK